MNVVWLINGIPGVGKTTTARALASSFPRAAHIEGDRVQELIVSGGVPPGGSPPEEESRQIRLNVRNQCNLAQSFNDAGFCAVIDYVIVNRERLAEYRAHLPGSDLRLVTLSPGVRVALERDSKRDKNVAHLWSHLDEVMKRELADTGLWIDNAEMTVPHVVDLIRSRDQEARI